MELKHCPFCGKKAHIRREGQGYRIMCASCGAKGPRAVIQEWHATKFIAQGKATEAWNRRAEHE